MDRTIRDQITKAIKELSNEEILDFMSYLHRTVECSRLTIELAIDEINHREDIAEKKSSYN